MASPPTPHEPPSPQAKSTLPSVPAVEAEQEWEEEEESVDLFADTHPPPRRPRVVVYLVVGVWMIFNMAFSFVNKWLFSHHGFRFPIILVSTNLCATSVMLWLGIWFWKGKDAFHSAISAIRTNWKMMTLVAVLTGSDLAFENASLVAVPISLNQVVKALGPVLLVLSSRVLEKKKYRWEVYVASMVLAGGTCLAVYKNPEADAWGVFAACMSAILGTCKTIAAAVILEKERNGASALEIAAATSFPAVLFIIPFFFIFEKSLFDAYLIVSPLKAAAALTGTSLLAVFYNWIHFQLIGVVGSIASGVVGVIKLPILVFLSILLWGNVLLWYNWVGMTLACVGFGLYQYYRPIGKDHKGEETRGVLALEAGYELVLQQNSSPDSVEREGQRETDPR